MSTGDNKQFRAIASKFSSILWWAFILQSFEGLLVIMQLVEQFQKLDAIALTSNLLVGRRKVLKQAYSMESDNIAAPTKGGIPGMHGVEHIGLTVPNLEEATEFFVNVLGCEVVYSLYPPRRPDGYLDLHPETDRKIRTLSCRNGAHFELFEYTAPDQNKQMPKSSDFGGHHVTFYVDDMDAAIAYLKSKAVYLFGEKKYGYAAEAGKDSTFVHFKTPWGLVLELISFPSGRVYEQEKPAMWKPKPLTP